MIILRLYIYIQNLLVLLKILINFYKKLWNKDRENPNWEYKV